MASRPEPGPLEVALQAHGFPQSGSWNMFDIAKFPILQLISVMSRYSAGQVNPYTVLVGEAMGLTFRMGAGGRARMDTALSKLPTISTLGHALELGFGIEDVIRVMAKNAGGCMLLGLGATLKDCYSDELAVEILLDYARATKADSKFMPSNMEWRNLLDACAGSLASSNFSHTAEHFMQLAGDTRLGAFAAIAAAPDHMRGCSLPLSIAQALVVLADISTGKMDSVIIRGGPDAGWLAAFADWFLDLRILIIREVSNETVFVNYVAPAEAQVRVVFARSSGMDAESGDVELGHMPAPLVHLSRRTYHVELQHATKIFLRHDRSFNDHVVAGRLEWKRLLRSTFLSSFESLMQVSETLACMIESAARIFQAIASAESGLPDLILRANFTYCEAAVGPGLIMSICDRFPELSKLRNSMEATLPRCSTFPDARKEYEKCISTLRTHCNCISCRDSGNGFSTADEDDDEDDDTSEEDHSMNPESERSGRDPNHFCQVIVVETIIVLARTLANTKIAAEELTPLRSGLEMAYGRRLATRKQTAPHNQHLKVVGQIAFCLDMDSEFSMGEKVDRKQGVELRMLDISELFAGRRPTAPVSYLSAMWTNGLTVFSETLLDMDCEQRNHVARIQVTPGRIQFKGKSYTRLTDITLNQDHEGSSWWGDVHSSLKSLARSDDAVVRTGLAIRESSIDLQCLLKFRVQSGSVARHGAFRSEPAIDIGPSALADFLGRRRGLVSCRSRSGSTCRELAGYSRWPKTSHIPGLTEINMNGKMVMFATPARSSEALSFVASCVNREPIFCSTYIVDRECVQCCLRTANAVNCITPHVCFIRVA